MKVMKKNERNGISICKGPGVGGVRVTEGMPRVQCCEEGHL